MLCEQTILLGGHVKKIILIGFILVFCQAALAQQPVSNVESLKFLLGKWVGEGTSEAGSGSGVATFEYSLKDKVLVRTNHAEYPATKDHPVVTHDDLMIIYADSRFRPTEFLPKCSPDRCHSPS